MTLDVQFLTMISMILSGFYLGVILDTFRRLSAYWKNSLWLTYLMEICFWMTQTMIIFYVLFRVNSGELRVYVFLACLLGFAAYQACAKRAYKILLERIIKMVAAVYRFCSKLVHGIVFAPIHWLVRMAIRLVAGLLKLASAILLFLLTVVFAPFKWVGKGLYLLLPGSIKRFFNKKAGIYSKMKNIIIKCLKFLRFKRR